MKFAMFHESIFIKFFFVISDTFSPDRWGKVSLFIIKNF